jgi:hypothetical protein
MGYNFLTGLKLVDTGRLRMPKEKNPTGLTVRIYLNRDDDNNSFGFDVVDSKEWKPFEALPRMILLGLTNKNEAKVDLFASCKYNENNSPKGDVITQGSVSTTLLDLVKSMGYMTEDQKYTDLQFVIEHPLQMEDGIAYIPKTIERGKKEGEKTYVKRENVTFYVVNTPENLEAMKKEVPESTTGTTIVVTN